MAICEGNQEAETEAAVVGGGEGGCSSISFVVYSFPDPMATHEGGRRSGFSGSHSIGEEDDVEERGWNGGNDPPPFGSVF